MSRILTIIMVAATLIAGALVAWQLAAGRQASAVLIKGRNQVRLSPQALADLESQSGLQMPAPTGGAPAQLGAQSSLAKTQKTLRQVQAVNHMNQRQQ